MSVCLFLCLLVSGNAFRASGAFSTLKHLSSRPRRNRLRSLSCQQSDGVHQARTTAMLLLRGPTLPSISARDPHPFLRDLKVLALPRRREFRNGNGKSRSAQPPRRSRFDVVCVNVCVCVCARAPLLLVFSSLSGSVLPSKLGRFAPEIFPPIAHALVVLFAAFLVCGCAACCVQV